MSLVKSHVWQGVDALIGHAVAREDEQGQGGEEEEEEEEEEEGPRKKRLRRSKPHQDQGAVGQQQLQQPAPILPLSHSGVACTVM